ncbi:hypothetical protein EX895_005154 [Sporisorium graminicola]|uniref:FAD-binding domain-containing protein n=1 Tax=Sporisorium graminicola TaxID=280036 RepID=A0A4V6ETE3_9BASI|nr:hypothetical protein EX895_005154 [Sporisorium graminicola]TKY86329.1 hypothetical protein EX895_005154 [Sporisorium graminicola]
MLLAYSVKQQQTDFGGREAARAVQHVALEGLGAAAPRGRGDTVGVEQSRRAAALSVYLIGDASHATLPHQGQGSSLAFEDAEALAAMLAELEDGSAAAVEGQTSARHECSTHASRVMARAANYAKGEKCDALRFSQLMLKYKGINDLRQPG